MRNIMGTIMVILLALFAVCWLLRYCLKRYARTHIKHNGRRLGKINEILEGTAVVIMSVLVLLAVAFITAN